MTRQSNVTVGGKITATTENSQSAAINKTQQLVTPTSVSTGSIGTYGAVTFATASSVSLNGVFTSEFDWYLIEYDATTSGAAAIAGTLRLLGTDATTAYDSQRTVSVNATTTTAQALNASTFNVSPGAVTGRHSGTIKVYNPALAVATTGTSFGGATANPMTTTAVALNSVFWQHRTTTAYDGITLTPTTGTFTGTVRVYGII